MLQLLTTIADREVLWFVQREPWGRGFCRWGWCSRHRRYWAKPWLGRVQSLLFGMTFFAVAYFLVGIFSRPLLKVLLVHPSGRSNRAGQPVVGEVRLHLVGYCLPLVRHQMPACKSAGTAPEPSWHIYQVQYPTQHVVVGLNVKSGAF